MLNNPNKNEKKDHLHFKFFPVRMTFIIKCIGLLARAKKTKYKKFEGEKKKKMKLGGKNNGGPYQTFCNCRS